ncbi:metal ABC transporter solute-binding protein, Zn/Mn family [Sporosarcina ureae]|uniref:metal ABC transporter solute-binding protein, Zn/Mn family n=1 Tax=Sporosarcina ureae TaxID=1571 RepID=UPI0009DC75F2|nr:zinc ABC transporter substrate-binding protein [Sporosarcina ureae]ARF16840.1 adhesin [Sporosarcina ureae]
MYKKIVVIIVSFTIVLLAACSNKGSEKESADQLSVYTTVYPLQYFTERIGGNHVDVKSIYPTGVVEDTFDPSQKELMSLANSDLFFYIGLGLEGFVENAEKTLENEHVKMVATSEAITEEMLGGEHLDEEHVHDDGNLDPHVWMSPILSDALAFSIKEALIELAPDKKDEFENNFENLRDDLLKLDREFIDMVSNTSKKRFFVSHATFGYIAETYGLEQVAIAGLNSQSKPSQKQLASFVEYAKAEDVKYIFFEPNVSSKLIEVLRKEIGAESLMLHNIRVLTDDDVKNKEDYFSLMNYNIRTLEKALSDE